MKDIRKTIEYKLWREAVLKRDKYTCRHCHKEYNLHVHHIKTFDEFPELKFAIDNGISFCDECHKEQHISGKYTIEYLEQHSMVEDTKWEDDIIFKI